MKFKKTILNIISFGTPGAIVFNLSMVLFFLIIVPTKYLVYSPVKCVFKHFLLPLVFRGNCPTSGLFANCECPTCGLTRAMSRLLHGDFAGAYTYNKLVFVVFAVMVVVIIVNLVKMMKEEKR